MLLEIVEWILTVRGPEDLAYARGLRDVAGCLADLGRWEEAEALLFEALETLQRSGGETTQLQELCAPYRALGARTSTARWRVQLVRPPAASVPASRSSAPLRLLDERLDHAKDGSSDAEGQMRPRAHDLRELDVDVTLHWVAPSCAVSVLDC